MQTTKLPRNMHLVPNMSKMDQPLSLKQISQTNKKVTENINLEVCDMSTSQNRRLLVLWQYSCKVIYTNKEHKDIWLSSRRVIFREPLQSSFRVCEMS